MRKTLLATVLAASVSAPVFAQTPAPASPHTLTANIALVSDYRFRGISQTFGRPALQGGFDYSHASGLYLGNWNSNVNEGAGFPGANLEMDIYGGWKKSFGDFGLDIGLIHYMYPGSNASNNAAFNSAGLFTNPRDGSRTHTGRVDNTEIYLGGSWKWLSVKYFHALSDYFSLAGTRGSNYLDISSSFDLGGGWGLNAHVGSFRLKNWHTGTDATNANFTDWKVGLTRDFGGWVLGASYIDTNAKGSCNPANPGFYCFGSSTAAAIAGVGGAGHKYRDAGRSTIVFSLARSF